MKNFATTFAAFALLACSPTAPVTDFSSENGIAIRYSAYDTVPTLTAEAREIAVQHCAKYGRFANYRGANAVNFVSTEEIHQFACESVKTDDSAIIAAQSQRPAYVPVPIYQPPQRTRCTTTGGITNCYTY